MFELIKKINKNFFLASFYIAFLSGCGSDEPAEGLVDKFATPEAQEIWWDAALPDFSENLDRPIITLIGEKTILLSVGDEYTEQGATASDTLDGDLSEQILINSQVDTEIAGDYLVRYLVTDNSQLAAIEQTRIVRVIENETERLSHRTLGTTNSNFGYLEHLPVNYGQNPDEKFPLIIYHHGFNGNAEFADGNPETALNQVIENYGPPRLIHDGEWDNDLPFIVLSPQAGYVEGSDPMARIDAFLEYAIRAYNVDTTRVYMTGFSQGGFLTYEYAMAHPLKVAAIATISAGTPFIGELPWNFCRMAKVPVWLFHGRADEVVPFGSSARAALDINKHCNPIYPPKLSLLYEFGHGIHHYIYNLTAMDGGELEGVYDERFDSYDQSIYDWLLSHSRDPE